jgi:hypothetical protein
MPSAKPTTSAPTSAGRINTETAAKLFQVTTSWIRRLTREGWIRKEGVDTYAVVDVVQGYLAFLKDEHRRASQSVAASRVANARAADIEARTAERLKASERAGEAAAIGAIDDVVGPLKSDLFAIPARLTTDLILRRRMEDAIDAALGALGKRALVLADKITIDAPQKLPATPLSGKRKSKKKPKAINSVFGFRFGR